MADRQFAAPFARLSSPGLLERYSSQNPDSYSFLRLIYLSRPYNHPLAANVSVAVGTTLEFAPRDTYPVLQDMVGGGPFNLEPGQWTDDTAMALALAESLLDRGELDEADLMQRFGV